MRIAGPVAAGLGLAVVVLTAVPTGRDNRTVQTPAGNELQDYYFSVLGIHLSPLSVLLSLLAAAAVAGLAYVVLGGRRGGSTLSG